MPNGGLINMKENKLVVTDIRSNIISLLLPISEKFESEILEFMLNTSDIETIHKLRLYLRKIKSTLFFGKKLIKISSYTSINKSLGFYNNSLASIRDLDMLILNCRYNNSNDKLINFIIKERNRLADNLKEKIIPIKANNQSLIYDSLKKIQWKHSIDCEKNTNIYLRNKIKKMLKNYFFMSKRINIYDLKEMHEFRLYGKKIKNVMELYIMLLDKKHIEIYKKLKKMLEIIGEVNDCYVAAGILLNLSEKNIEISVESKKMAKKFKKIGNKKRKTLNKYCWKIRQNIKPAIN